MKNATFAEIEAFMRKKGLFTCKEDLDNIIDSFIYSSLTHFRGDGENAVFQITNEFTILRYLHIKKIVMTVRKTLKKTASSRMKRMTVTLETFTKDPNCGTMNSKVDWICAKIQKIKEFQAVSENKFSKLQLANTTPERHTL